MIKTRRCPKCGGIHIAGPHRLINAGVGISFWAVGRCVVYTCADCGYMEFYSDERDLKKIRKAGRFLSTPKESTKPRCPTCGAELQPEAVFCPECETVLKD